MGCGLTTLPPKHKRTMMDVFPEPPLCPTYLLGLLCTSTADTLCISECPMSQAELLPQPGCQTSGISRQIFKILKLYLDNISGSKRECIKGKVQYMVAFHTVPVKNGMPFCVEIQITWAAAKLHAKCIQSITGQKGNILHSWKLCSGRENKLNWNPYPEYNLQYCFLG